MADNVTLSTGEIVRTLEDGSSVHHPISIQAYATTVGTPDVISIPLAAALADNTSNPTTVLYGTCLLAYDGATWDRVRGDSTDGLLVNLGANNDVSAAQSGTWTVRLWDGTTVATVLDLSTSNPLAVALVDGDGDQLTTLPITDGGGSITVDGTVAATQSGTWNITNVSGTVSLPTGASTAAKQPALGTAGTASADVITVQGIASMTALKVDGSAVTQPVSLTSTTVTGTVAVTQSGTWDEVGINDSGNSITVDAPVGTPVFVRLSDGASAISTLPVSLASVPSHAVTNAGTFAVQAAQSGTWTVDLGATDNAVLDTIASPVATISATPLQRVAIFNAADTQITSFGGGTEYTEDDAAAANPVGGAMILVRADALAGVTTTDGDNVAARGTDKGEVYVKHADSIAVTNASLTTLAGAVSGTEMQVDVLTMPTVTVNAHAVTNAGTFAVQVDGAALTSLQLIDDAAVVLGTATYTEATSTGLAIGAVRRDADTTLVNTTNEWGPLQMDANGRLKVEAFSGEALPVTFTGSTDVATQTTLASALTSLQTIDNCISGTGVNVSQMNGVAVTMGNGASGTGVQRVTIANDSTGTLGTVSNVTTVATVTTLTGSALAHDEVDSGNPHKIGMRAIAHGTNPTAVAAADRTHLYANRAGIPFVIGGHPNIVTRTATILDSDGAQTNVAIWTVSAGTKIVITRVSITADGSTTGPTNVKVGFGTATLAAASTTGTAGILADFLGVPPGGGVVIGDGSGIIGVGADDEDVRITVEDPVGGAVTISVSGYTIES